MVLRKKTGLRELALFAGAGGGILGGLLLGWRTVCAVEIEEYPRAVLLQRQLDGILPQFPIWDDIRTFDGRPWRGKVDIISGGFPCQDISSAGKGKGIEGERSGLWKEMARIISEVRPKFAFMENSPLLISRGLTTVLGDLAEMGYDARWCVLGGKNVNAPCNGDRMWMAATDKTRRRKLQKKRHHIAKKQLWFRHQWHTLQDIEKDRLEASAEIVRKSDVMADWVDRVESIGNGQIPAVAALAWETLTYGID